MAAISLSWFENQHPDATRAFFGGDYWISGEWWGVGINYRHRIEIAKQQTVAEMKTKLKLPNHLTEEQKQVLQKGKRLHADLGDLKMFMSQLHKMLEYDQTKEIAEVYTEIKANHAEISKTKHRLGEGLTAIGMLPHKPKSAKRTAPTLSK